MQALHSGIETGKEMGKESLLITAALLLNVSLFSGGEAWAQDSWLRHNAYACQVYDGSDQAKFLQSLAGIYRKTSTGGGTKSVMCPMMRTAEWGATLPSYVKAAVGFVKPTGATLTCYFRTYDWGGLISTSSPATAGSGIVEGQLSIQLALPSTATGLYHNLHCLVPEGTRLTFYSYWEE